MSRLDISMLIGVPSVCPSKTPDRILTASVFFRWVTMALLARPRPAGAGPLVAPGHGQRRARGAAVEDGTDTGAVRLAPGRYAEQAAPGVAHASRIPLLG